jgi:hypothetical protein
MKRQEKIEFLKGLVDGTKSIDKLVAEEEKEERQKELFYKRTTCLELERFRRNINKYGDSDKWPEPEISFLNQIVSELEERLPHEWNKGFSVGSSVRANLPCELHITKYSNGRKSAYAMTVGYDQSRHPNVIYPADNEYFEFEDLSSCEPKIDFDKVIRFEFSEIAAIMVREKKETKRSEKDQELIDYLIRDTNLRANIQEKWDNSKDGDYFIITYLDGTTRIAKWNNFLPNYNEE